MGSDSVAFAFAALVAIREFRFHWLARLAAIRARQAACSHVWERVSLYNEGRYWTRRCTACGLSEPCDPPEKHDGDT